jgi:serine/threonine-protein kinase
MGEPMSERASNRDDPRVGTTLGGKFTIVRLVGRGGMGAVYEVRDPEGSPLAAKIITRGVVGSTVDPHEIRRLLREARAATKIVSPNVLRALDVGEDEATGAPFLILELLTGMDLARLLSERAPLAQHGIVRVLRQAARGLSAAHAFGVIHRDVKPANLYLHVGPDGHVVVKVCDFGIAKHGLEGRDFASTELTQTGSLLGSPAYMSPEQTQSSKQLDARSDVWGLAVILYEALSGRRLWPPDSSLGELILAICTRPIPKLVEVAPWVDPALGEVVDRGLERDLERRFPSAEALGDALEPFTGGTDELRLDELTTVASELRRKIDADAATREEAPSHGGPVSDEAKTASLMPPPLPAAAPDTEISAASEASSERRARRAKSAIVAAMLAVVAALTLAIFQGREKPLQPKVDDRPPCARDGDCHGNALICDPGGHCAAVANDAGTASCATNAECVSKSGGRPAICRKADATCVELETAECHVLAEAGDLSNDATIWVGAMFPLTGPMAESYGHGERDAVHLARRDFAETAHGLPPVEAGGPRRPLGVVLCDDASDPPRVATHLIDDVGVPAVLGFALSDEVIRLASTHFNPKGVLAFAANTAATLRGIPTPAGSPRLIWRPTVSTDMMSAPRVAFVSDYAEPHLRATHALAPNEPMRVALARFGNASGLASADHAIGALRFNGKTVAENGDAFRQFVMRASGDVREAERVAAELAAFQPHVIIDAIDDLMLPSVEQAWPKSARFRPIYIGTDASDAASAVWLRAHPEARTRVFNTDTLSTTTAVAKRVLRHNEVFANKITATSGGNGAYDSFYVLAYALAALGSEPISGRALARAIRRLMPPGPQIDVGPAGIVDVLHALEAGKNVDLVGTITTLDFNLESGDAPADFEVTCYPSGLPVPSGLVFRASTQKLEGKLLCPP